VRAVCHLILLLGFGSARLVLRFNDLRSTVTPDGDSARINGAARVTRRFSSASSSRVSGERGPQKRTCGCA
jgi:hypothetical protein